jgi:hypothetical protein
MNMTNLYPAIIPCWVIYDHPTDFPDHWVVRKQIVNLDSNLIYYYIACLCESLDEARQQIPPGYRLYEYDRIVAGADPHIHEFYLEEP